MNLPATSSTSQASAWLEPRDKLGGLSRMDRLWNRFDGMYPGRWRHSFAGGQAIANWREAWAAKFESIGMTVQDVMRGLETCDTSWPPSLNEFVKFCRPPIDYNAALIEAVKQMRLRETGDDQWSHPAIYWAAADVGAWELHNRSAKEIDANWRRALGEQLARREWPEIPVRRPALPAPGETHTSQRGRETVAEMMARLRSAAAAHESQKSHSGGEEWD